MTKMVHSKRCPHKYWGEPTVEFYINNEPQVYCMGFIDRLNNAPLESCLKCKNFYKGEQCRQDYKDYLKEKKLA